MIQPTSILVNLFVDLLFLQVKKVTSNLAITCILFGCSWPWSSPLPSWSISFSSSRYEKSPVIQPSLFVSLAAPDHNPAHFHPGQSLSQPSLPPGIKSHRFLAITWLLSGCCWPWSSPLPSWSISFLTFSSSRKKKVTSNLAHPVYSLAAPDHAPACFNPCQSLFELRYKKSPVIQPSPVYSLAVTDNDPAHFHPGQSFALSSLPPCIRSHQKLSPRLLTLWVLLTMIHAAHFHPGQSLSWPSLPPGKKSHQ